MAPCDRPGSRRAGAVAWGHAAAAQGDGEAAADAWLANQALPRAVVLAAARGDVAALAAVRHVAGLPLLV